MQDKSILITGCSSGIGLCAARLLKKRGYRVFATARNPIDVGNLITEGFESTTLDVTSKDSMHAAVEYVLECTGGTLYALFNNAGYLQAGAIEDLTSDVEREQFATNVFGPMELIRMLLPVMRRQGYGRIIQNSSILGVITLPYCGAYNASKFALEGFSNTLRQELRNTPIRVSIINPGPITSNLRNNAWKHSQDAIKDASSPYKKHYQNMEKNYFQGKESQKISHSPEKVVKKLIHALESSHPHAHYYVGFSAKLLAVFRRILPDVALDWLLAKAR